MKRIILFTFILCVGTAYPFAQIFNGYKYIRFEVNQNPYDIERSLYDAFNEMGFNIVSNTQYAKMDDKAKALTLLVDYNYWSGPASTAVELVIDNRMDVVWSSLRYGKGYSTKSKLKDATKQIINSLKSQGYKYIPNLLNQRLPPFIFKGEYEIKEGLRLGSTSPLEGIYMLYYDKYSIKIAILKDKDIFKGIVLDSNYKEFPKGRIKIILKEVNDNEYICTIGAHFLSSFNMVVKRGANNTLEDYYNDNTTPLYKFVKVFPYSTCEVRQPTKPQNQCKATGSGVFIYDNYIVTNYHVIKDAKRIEAVVNINGVAETFNARVLCTDKTNDLAIVCIQDDKFKREGIVPFKILPNTIDVGTSVFTMGFPLSTVLGEEVKITDGIISSKTGYEGDVVTYQISAPIQPGNSGGPLFDKSGNLVGITSAGLDKSLAENVGYAIKTPYVLNLIDSAPITIPVPKGKVVANKDLPDLIKDLKPYVVYIKIY